jgi:outer membrane receptor for ferrienterochelin and colicins
MPVVSRCVTILRVYLPLSVWLAAAPAHASPSELADLNLEALMQVKVRSAALHEQRAHDAPASVTVITHEEIARYGYRTLAEALSWVTGFYMVSDRSYYYPGVRGFNLPGDFNTRFLVLIDGHNLTSNVDNSASVFGEDFPLDLALVEQIEVIRGTSSALYGSNGIFGTINIVTRPAESLPAASVRVEAGSFGERKAQAVSSLQLGQRARLLLSASFLESAGEREIALPVGTAVGADGENGRHFFARFAAGNWTVTGLYGSRRKVQPVSWAETVLSDRGTRITDTRGFAEVRHARTWKGGEWTLRAWYDVFHFDGDYRYRVEEGVEDSHDRFSGDWVGTQLSARYGVGRAGAVTAGVEGKGEFRTRMRAYVTWPGRHDLLDIDQPDRAGAVFGQHEITLGGKWDLGLGARADFSRNYGTFISPRATLIWRPADATRWKLIVGRAFRQPSAYEMYYDDVQSFIANPSARAESSTSIETVAEQRLARGLHVSVAAYRNRLSDLLVAEHTGSGAMQYRNAGQDRASGVEGELRAAARGAELRAGLAVQRGVAGDSRAVLPNSPGQVGHVHASVPLPWRGLRASAGMQYMGERRTMAAEPIPAFHLVDATLVSAHPARGFAVQAGVRNLLDRRYRHPVGLAPDVDAIGARGRSLFVTVTWRTPADAAP